jgi:putative salt-induced outer membrane protein YdiY
MVRFAGVVLALFLVHQLAVADRIELLSGDSVSGTIVERTDSHIVIEHAVLGTLSIPRDQIASMPEPPTADAAAEIVEQVEPEPVASKWKSSIDVGMSGSQGNTDNLDFRVAFETLNETDIARWRIDASYNYGETNSEKNKSQATVGVLRDWLMPDSPWLIFAQGRYNYDEFRDWTHRATGHGGVGYEFIKTDTYLLIGRLGAGAAKEWKRTESLRPEGLIGGEFRWNINDAQTLSAHTTLYPALDDFFEFRVVSGVRWTMMLDRARGLALSAGIDNEYESETDPGIKKNDFKFFAGITFKF